MLRCDRVVAYFFNFFVKKTRQLLNFSQLLTRLKTVAYKVLLLFNNECSPRVGMAQIGDEFGFGILMAHKYPQIETVTLFISTSNCQICFACKEQTNADF